MILVVGKLKMKVKKDQQRPGYANGQAGQIQRNMHRMSKNIPLHYLQIVFYHGFLKFNCPTDLSTINKSGVIKS
jgi:hypothetical protein